MKDEKRNDLDWDAALKHFNAVRKQVKETHGMNAEFTVLKKIFNPLELRFCRGIRTRKLYDAMMNVK